jgi:hypothetical protein
MIDSVMGRDRLDGEWINAFKTPNVVAVLIGIRPSLMVRINAAARAEVVSGCIRIELIQRQRFFALKYA